MIIMLDRSDRIEAHIDDNPDQLHPFPLAFYSATVASSPRFGGCDESQPETGTTDNDGVLRTHLVYQAAASSQNVITSLPKKQGRIGCAHVNWSSQR